MASHARKIRERRFYFDELMSEGCQCGKSKRSGYSFWFSCYWKLPMHMQRDLYKLIGEGYEEAYEAAVEFLTN